MTRLAPSLRSHVEIKVYYTLTWDEIIYLQVLEDFADDPKITGSISQPNQRKGDTMFLDLRLREIWQASLHARRSLGPFDATAGLHVHGARMEWAEHFPTSLALQLLGQIGYWRKEPVNNMALHTLAGFYKLQRRYVALI